MSKLSPKEAALLDRLLDIIAAEGLVERAKLDRAATLDEVGLTADDLTLIGNAIEREFDRDMLHDEAFEQARTVGELLDLMARRIASQSP
ncbi:hypothetical protein ACWIGM_05165 [Bosea sp. NPDC055332]